MSRGRQPTALLGLLMAVACVGLGPVPAHVVRMRIACDEPSTWQFDSGPRLAFPDSGTVDVVMGSHVVTFTRWLPPDPFTYPDTVTEGMEYLLPCD